MATAIDESGTSSPDSNRYYHLGAVWMPNDEEVGLFKNQVDELLKRFKFKEFKSSKAHNHRVATEAFFEAACERRFMFAVCSIDKEAQEWAGRNRSVLFWAAATHLAACLWPTYQEQQGLCLPRRLNEQMVVDDNEDTAFLRAVQTAFRPLTLDSAERVNREGDTMMGKISFAGSWHPLIQLADMLVGAVARSLRCGQCEWWQRFALRERAIDVAMLD